MRPTGLLFGILLALDLAQVAGAEQDPMQATIWNASDEDIIVVLQIPSRPDLSLCTVQVPSQTVVVRVPLPKVQDDMLAIAFRAREAREGLELERPARIVGMRKLFPSERGPVVNSTVPVLKYTAYDSGNEFRRRGGGYPGGMPRFFAEEGHYHSRALWAPPTTLQAEEMRDEALRSATLMVYEEPE